MAKVFEKGDDESLVYGIDWSQWLATNSDTIATSTWVVPTGLTNVAEANTTTQATIQLSGGTIGDVYEITNIITTTITTETAERTIKVKIVEHKYK